MNIQINKVDGTSKVADPFEVDGKGYILDEPYIWRYFDLQSPTRMQYSLRSAGYNHAIPETFSYCELGCGNGVTTNILADLYPESRFVGLDFNADHINNARKLAADGGLSNVQFDCLGFEDGLSEDYPQFDYITVHGVYSWVDKEVQSQMFEFIRKFLKPDGIAYISYNALPGWSAKEPLWRLLNTHIRSVKGSSIDRVEKGLSFLEYLRDTDAPYFAQNPVAAEHLAYLRSEDPHYISHEFCNEKFAPVYASQAFEHAGEYGLRFLAQAETCYDLPFENIDPQYRHLIDALETDEEKESWRSMLRNEEFRTDLYTKDAAPKNDLENSLLWTMYFSNIAPFSTMTSEIVCGSRTLNLTDPMVSAIVGLCEDGMVTANELCGHQDLCRYSPREILETMQLLELSGYFAFSDIGYLDQEIDLDGKWTINGASGPALMKARMAEDKTAYLPAPAIGTAIVLSAVDAYAILALDGNDPDDAADRLLNYLNNEAPELLNFATTRTWAENYLQNFKQTWGRILLKVGAISVEEV